MSKPRVPKKVLDLLRPVLAEVWEQGYQEGAEDNREEHGRKVRYGAASNPYKEDS